jgi:hypothetical protein
MAPNKYLYSLNLFCCRFADLKNCEKIAVGVRIKDSEEWMEVGRVKSEKDEFTEVAVARQRALIADHARRLYLVLVRVNVMHC